MRVEREPSWGRSDHFSQRYIFCLYTWYNIDHVLCMVCLCGAAQGQEGFFSTKQTRTLDQIYIIYKDRGAPPIGGPALDDSGVKTVQWREREGHDSYQEVEVYMKYIYICCLLYTSPSPRD